jgi:hypothetical protein
MRFVQFGFLVFQKAEYSVEDHIANSSIFVFPIINHHLDSRFLKQVAEYGATYFSSILEPTEEIYHLVMILSLIHIGAQCKGKFLNLSEFSFT